MGQHKHNPTAIAAKNGELPTKPLKPSKRQIEAEIYAKIEELPIIRDLRQAINNFSRW